MPSPLPNHPEPRYTLPNRLKSQRLPVAHHAAAESAAACHQGEDLSARLEEEGADAEDRVPGPAVKLPPRPARRAERLEARARRRRTECGAPSPKTSLHTLENTKTPLDTLESTRPPFSLTSAADVVALRRDPRSASFVPAIVHVADAVISVGIAALPGPTTHSN